MHTCVSSLSLSLFLLPCGTGFELRVSHMMRESVLLLSHIPRSLFTFNFEPGLTTPPKLDLNSQVVLELVILLLQSPRQLGAQAWVTMLGYVRVS